MTLHIKLPDEKHKLAVHVEIEAEIDEEYRGAHFKASHCYRIEYTFKRDHRAAGRITVNVLDDTLDEALELFIHKVIKLRRGGQLEHSNLGELRPADPNIVLEVN